ncbi:hypothetical protein MUO98_05005 [Candidatus Bathyarchaeota archaeon]|nr:hypothetical protein [Candidatus Bathyarchaeota archaeon]
MAEWKKGKSKAGKIPTKAFSAVLTAMYPTQIKTGTGILELAFEGDIKLGIFGIDKATITDDEVEVGGSLADFQESLIALGYDCLWGTEDAEILGFDAQKDGQSIIGCKLWMKPLEEQTIGDDTQTKKSLFWGTVEKIERVTTSAPSRPATPPINVPGPGKKPIKKTQEPASSNISTITKRIIDEGVDTMGVGDLYTHFKKEYKPGEIRKAIEELQ